MHECNLHFTDWVLVAEKKTCNRPGKSIGNLNINSCADKCKGIASMFKFHRHDDCPTGVCACFCEISAKPDGTCNTLQNRYYNLYKYKGNYYLHGVIKASSLSYLNTFLF